MPTSCCAFGCHERSVKGGPVTFHSFPQDEMRRKLWQLQIRRADFKVTIHSKLCSKHFTPDSFDTEKFGGTWLKKTAIPTLFNFPPDLSIKSDPNKEKLLKDFCERNAEVDRSSLDLTPMKRKHYIGDFTDEDMDCPENARKVLHLAKSQCADSRQKIRDFRRKMHRLTIRNRKLEIKVGNLQEKLECMQKQLSCKRALKCIQQQQNPEILKIISNSGSDELS